MTKSNPKPINFEDSITKLNQLIEQLEKGNLSLEKSLLNFEQGIQLIRQCQTILNEAEQKVEILSKQHTQELLEPYVHPTDENL